MGADGSALLRQERYDWSHIPNLDNFFVRLYVYFNDKGFLCSLVRAPPSAGAPTSRARQRSAAAWQRSAAAQRGGAASDVAAVAEARLLA